MKNIGLISLIACIAILCGCAHLSSTTYDRESGQATTRVTAFALFDSHNELLKFKNTTDTTKSNEWSAGTSIGSINQTATSTNLNEILGVIVGAAVKAAAKP